MTIASYKQVIKYLESFIGKIIFKVDKEYLKHHDPLERMRVFLSLLGNPQEKFKSVLIGGTSGKGSTAYLISHILITAGYKTGLTISPHLQKINERLQINGEQISDEKFTELTTSMIRIIKAMRKMPIGGPSYFEILIGMAFLYFARSKVDIAVVEVGMGGEFDATNTLSPLIAVLTNVSLDHTSILGKTVEKIAKTKAGIIKGLRIKDKGLINNSSLIIHHLPVVTGIKQPTVVRIIEERCRKVGAQLFWLGKDFNYKIKKESIEGSIFDLISQRDRVRKLNDLKLSLLGDYQVENASIAIKTVLELEKFGFKVSDNEIRRALSTAFFPGRFEAINYTLDAKRYTLILDGAHNPTKMKEFLKNLKKLFPNQKKVFIVGFKFDKDIPKMLKQITKVADEIIITEFNRATDMSVSASAEAESIKYYVSSIKYQGEVYYEKNSKRAMEKAFEMAGKDDLIVVTGSLYLVGEIRNKIGHLFIDN